LRIPHRFVERIPVQQDDGDGEVGVFRLSDHARKYIPPVPDVLHASR
jgi:hypothetical protein